jgi:hypothetical protein
MAAITTSKPAQTAIIKYYSSALEKQKIMLNYNTIFLFVFVFSILTNVRLVVKFVSALLHNPPQKMVLSSRELIFNGLMLSYLITYIINLI